MEIADGGVRVTTGTTQIGTTYEGTSNMQMPAIAKNMLK